MELQNELNQSRQQAANELAALSQEVRGAPLRGTQATGVGVGTRLLGKPSDFSGVQDAWRDWSTVFKGYAGAAMPRLQKLMDETAKAAATIPNATILEEKDRAASTQLHWMMLTICKGAALQIVFLAGDSEGLEAWRQLTEKYEPKMRTRFAGQLMSTLSFSFQCGTAERITAWVREIATCELDSGETLDDEIKVGTVLLRLPESQLKTHLLLRVDKLKSGQTSATKCLRFLVRLPLPSHSRHRWTLEQWASGNQARVRDRKELANVTIRLSKHVSGAETRITLLQTVLTLTNRAESVERLIFWNSAAQGQGWSEGQGRRQRCECCQDLLELW